MNKECIVEFCHKDCELTSVFCKYHGELVTWRENHKNNY